MKISTANISRHVNRFEKAVRADAWKGAQHPEDIPGIERELKLAKDNLTQFMRESIIG